MPVLTEDETEELVEMATEILDEGIQVSLRPGDLQKVFTAVVLANVTAYFAVVGIKNLSQWIDRKRSSGKLVLIKEKVVETAQEVKDVIVSDDSVDGKDVTKEDVIS